MDDARSVGRGTTRRQALAIGVGAAATGVVPVAGAALAESPPDAPGASIASTAIDPGDVHLGYLETLDRIERLHRRLLDIVKDEFDRRERSDVTAVQALLLYNVGDAELTAGELRIRGFYLGSNVSYHLKRLVETGYLHHQRSRRDRRSVRISLTEKGQEVRAIVADLYAKHTRSIATVAGVGGDDFRTLNVTLVRLERFWTDQIRFRL